MAIRVDSIQQAVDNLQDYFLPENAENVDAVIQLEFLGDGGGNWYLTIKDQTLLVSEGNANDPTMTLTVAAVDWLKVANKETSPMALVMQGKLKLNGDMNMAMKFQEMFSMS